MMSRQTDIYHAMEWNSFWKKILIFVGSQDISLLLYLSRNNCKKWRFWTNRTCNEMKNLVKQSSAWSNRLTQSICTHYSCFENQGRFVTLKKIRQPAFWKKQGAKNRVIVIQKEKRPGCLFSFWITMTLVFCTLLFEKSRVKKQGTRFFFRVKNRPWFSKQE